MTSLQELFRPEDLLVDFEALDKWQAIERMMRHLIDAGRVPAHLAKLCHEAVFARERSMSTGMERGIAIPHAAVEGLQRTAACLAILSARHGLDFESIDRGATHFIVLLLIPRERKLLHIRTLADVARALSKEHVRARLLEARDSAQAWTALREE